MFEHARSAATSMEREAAEGLAVAGLARLAGDDELMMRFSALSGIAANDIRQAASEPGFLVGVLDFYLGNESDLVAWAKDDGFAPELAARARFTLSPDDTSGF